MHKHTVMNLIWNNMILLKISPFKAATVNLTSNILSKLCFILFSTCSTLNFTSLKTGWPYFDLSCFKSVHMQKPSPMSICGLLDWGAGIYSIISWWCCNVLLLREEGCYLCSSSDSVGVSSLQAHLEWKSSGLSRQDQWATGHAPLASFLIQSQAEEDLLWGADSAHCL